MKVLFALSLIFALIIGFMAVEFEIFSFLFFPVIIATGSILLLRSSFKKK